MKRYLSATHLYSAIIHCVSAFSPFACFFVIYLFVLEAKHCVADDLPIKQQISRWIQQLGDESFYVRQHAETLLIQAGIQAYPDLQRAKKHIDVEIVQRAKSVLTQIERSLLKKEENQEVAATIQLYQAAPNLADKARIMWILADPCPSPPFERGFDQGEGLPTLCRQVQFEEQNALRLEAAKTLIAFAPASPIMCRQWYQYLLERIQDPGDDAILQILTQHAQLWCDINNPDGKVIDSRTIDTDAAVQERVRQVCVKTLGLIDRSDNALPTGTKVDILIHYAVAKIQEQAGLIDDRDQTVAAALALPPTTMPTALYSGPYDNMPMNEHYYVGWYLQQQFRLDWAEQHFHKVMETYDEKKGEIFLHILTSNGLAEIELYRADYLAAASFYEKYIDIVATSNYGDTPQRILTAKRQIAYCLAKNAFEEGQWDTAQKKIMMIWADSACLFDTNDMDMVILAYHIGKKLSESESDEYREFKEKTDFALLQVWRSLNDEFGNMPDLYCNSAAWLLAHTDGNYESALTLAETAVHAEPDNPNLLDTLAHVYFLGGKVDDAIRTQEKVVLLAPEVVVLRQALERFQQAK